MSLFPGQTLELILKLCMISCIYSYGKCNWWSSTQLRYMYNWLGVTSVGEKVYSLWQSCLKCNACQLFWTFTIPLTDKVSLVGYQQKKKHTHRIILVFYWAISASIFLLFFFLLLTELWRTKTFSDVTEIYSISQNLTDISQNNNKFHRSD